MIIDGKAIARKIIEELKKLPKLGKALAAVFVGDSAASESFLKQKRKIAEELGIEFRLVRFSELISEADLIKEIKTLGENNEIGGILIQLPLPGKFDRDRVLAAINPAKDVDALTAAAPVSALAVEVVKDVLDATRFAISDAVVGVVGRGILIGQPIAEWLSGRCREVIIFHTQTDFTRLKDCDLVIIGVGKAGLVKPEMLQSGAGVIDFGFDVVDGKIAGGLDASRSTIHDSRLTFYTPTPGGTGPILVAEIFKNFYRLNGQLT